ncbi:MAG: HPr(Ser) kinase/phosphatase [Chromatiales bacterium]|jgi:HPr kinase/phosphorylase
MSDSTFITIKDVYDSLEFRLSLHWIAGLQGADRIIANKSSDKRTETLAGPLNYIHPNRIQIIGHTELDYLNDMQEEARQDALRRLFRAEPAAVILSDDIDADDFLIDAANDSETPLMLTPVTYSQLLAHLHYHLSIALAEHTSIHGVYLEVLGMGVLLSGDAAVGKSELALELIYRGNRLIADDAPEFSRIAPDIISGHCPELLQDFLEVRGLGIINIRKMFGDSAIKRSKYLRLIVRLEKMTDEQLSNMDRLTGSYATTPVLGLEIPQVTVPVAPGRNLAILVETAVRNHIMRLKGYDAAETFIERQRKAIEEGARQQ